MGNKLSAIGIIVLIVVLIASFILYVYMFSATSGVSDVQIVIPGQIRGISIGNNVSGNFKLPEDAPLENVDLISPKIEERIESSESATGGYPLFIEKIGVENEAVERGNSLEILQNDGWILLPWSYKSDNSFFSFLPWVEKKEPNEAIILCYRRFFGETHPMSCMRLNELSKGDLLEFDSSNYLVESVSVVDKSLDTIFNTGDSGYLKIITSTGNDINDTMGDSKYLVVIAQKSI